MTWFRSFPTPLRKKALTAYRACKKGDFLEIMQNKMKRIIIAIDGPAASGKSTTAKLLASRLGYIYLDTGAMYRACALQCKQLGLNLEEKAKIIYMMENLELQIGQSSDGNIIILNGQDISTQIRTPEISSLASAISALPEVREKMVALQRKLGEKGGVVLDGRDIGTVVFPQAEAKFFLIANVEERANRRYLELQAKGLETPYEQVWQELQERDQADSSRAIAPLKPAHDAIQIDTSRLSIAQQVSCLFTHLEKLLDLPIVRLAQHSGYCFGVRRALNLALEAKNDEKPVFTLGEIIHNPQIVEQLANKGIRVAKQAASVKDSRVIIRSHGITKTELQTLADNGNEIIDATCPYVKRTHEILQKLVAEGYPVLILGDKDHPEVIGMLSHGDNKTRVISPDDTLPNTDEKKIALMAQTTQKLQFLSDLACKLLSKCNELRVFNTICLATSERQSSTVELAKASDLMLVIGGHNSANTRALASLSSAYCPTFHIETEAELEEMELGGHLRIGMAAGASTPDEMIVKVYNRVLQKSGNTVAVKCSGEIPMFKEESC